MTWLVVGRGLSRFMAGANEIMSGAIGCSRSFGLCCIAACWMARMDALVKSDLSITQEVL